MSESISTSMVAAERERAWAQFVSNIGADAVNRLDIQVAFEMGFMAGFLSGVERFDEAHRRMLEHLSLSDEIENGQS